jgi:hypothetical protein
MKIDTARKAVRRDRIDDVVQSQYLCKSRSLLHGEAERVDAFNCSSGNIHPIIRMSQIVSLIRKQFHRTRKHTKYRTLWYRNEHPKDANLFSLYHCPISHEVPPEEKSGLRRRRGSDVSACPSILSLT